MLALEHIKVVDISISGPGHFATQYLGDLGADVIRVVPLPGSGRANYVLTDAAANAARRDLAADFMNRNKRCIAINLKSPEGKEAFMRLAATVDVIVEGGRPGTARRLGIDYEEVRKVNPGIIYCSLSGYGQEGPYAHLPGHDLNYIGYAGILSVVGEMDGPPVIPDNYLADLAGASLHAVIGITTAIVARERTNRGQFVDVSYTDAALSLNATSLGMYLLMGHAYDRGGMPTCGGYPAYSVYKARDGKWLTLGCVEPWFWENACRVLGLEEYIQDGVFPPDAYLKKRPDNPRYAEIRRALEDKFRTRDRDEWVALLQKNDVPAGAAYEMDEVAADPHLKQRMVIEVDVPGVGQVRQPGFPVKLSETPARFRRPAPGFGEHTDDILRSLGYSAEEVARMRSSRAVA